jgi:copper(I)-binding protein
MKHTGHHLGVAFLFVGQAQAQTSTQDTIVVDHPWARATPPGRRDRARDLAGGVLRAQGRFRVPAPLASLF